MPDPAAAIYHYERYLKLNPNAGNADLIRQRIDACKQQLAADVLGLPSSSAAQQQLEKLAEQNRELQQQVDRLQETVKQWNAYYASQLAARSNSPPQNNSIAQPNTDPAPDDISAQRRRHRPDANQTRAAETRQAAHAHGRRRRNGGRHRAQVRREIERAGGGEPRRESGPESASDRC